MFCPNCGKKIDDGSAFCEECGSRILSTAVNADRVVKSTTVENKQKGKFDFKLLISIFLPLISLISYMIAYIDAWLYGGINYDYSAALSIGIVSFILMFVFDIKHGRQYKIHIVLDVLCFISAVAATVVVLLSRNNGAFLDFRLKVFVVLPSLAFLGLIFLIRFVWLVSKYHSILFIITAALVIAFSLTSPKAGVYINRYHDASRAAKIEEETKKDLFGQDNTSSSQKNDGSINIIVGSEPDLAGDIDNNFYGDIATSSKTSSLLYGSVSGISGILLIVDGIFVYIKAKKKYSL